MTWASIFNCNLLLHNALLLCVYITHFSPKFYYKPLQSPVCVRSFGRWKNLGEGQHWLTFAAAEEEVSVIQDQNQLEAYHRETCACS